MRHIWERKITESHLKSALPRGVEETMAEALLMALDSKSDGLDYATEELIDLLTGVRIQMRAIAIDIGISEEEVNRFWEIFLNRAGKGINF